MIPPHRGAKFLEGSNIADEQSWVYTNRATLQVKDHPEMYALGDTTNLPISKAGSTAHFEGPVVAERLAAQLRGLEPGFSRSLDATVHGRL